MRPPTNPVLRSILALMTGIGIGGVVVALVELINAQIFPLPAGVGIDDPEALGQAIADAGPSALVGVVIAWFMGPFSGAWIATLVSRSPGRLLGGIVTLFFFAGSLMNLFAFPHPAWFWVAGLTAVALGGHLGWMVAASSVRRRSAEGGAWDSPAGGGTRTG